MASIKNGPTRGWLDSLKMRFAVSIEAAHSTTGCSVLAEPYVLPSAQTIAVPVCHGDCRLFLHYTILVSRKDNNNNRSINDVMHGGLIHSPLAGFSIVLG